MHDEARKINNLTICVGHVALGSGLFNPAPFVLIGPTTLWVGLVE